MSDETMGMRPGETAPIPDLDALAKLENVKAPGARLDIRDLGAFARVYQSESQIGNRYPAGIVSKAGDECVVVCDAGLFYDIVRLVATNLPSAAQIF